MSFANKLYVFFALFIAMLSYLVLTAPDDGWVWRSRTAANIVEWSSSRRCTAQLSGRLKF